MSACSVLGPIDTPDVHTYQLRSGHFSNRPAYGKKITLMLSTITASPGYQTKNMIYNRKPFELSSFTKNEWAGPPAEMLQPMIMQCLRSTGYFHAVIAPPVSADRNLRLNVNLIELRQDFTCKPSRVRMAIQAELIDDASDKVINSRVFSTSVATKSDTPYGGVYAANYATKYLLRQLTRFCVNTVVHKNISYKIKKEHKNKLHNKRLTHKAKALPKPKLAITLPTP